MQKIELARKQKRLEDWNKSLLEEGIPDDVKQEFVTTLKSYRNLLARIWEAEDHSDAESSQLADLERTLQNLHTASRYHKL